MAQTEVCQDGAHYNRSTVINKHCVPVLHPGLCGCLNQALEIFERLDILLEPDKVRAELAQLPEA